MSGGKSVFIGNIPYGVTEETIIDTLSRAGPVVTFRLVYDKDTGRPKGFGFAEFSDSDAAASAVRNLDNYEIMGRKLRVDWSNDGGDGNSGNVPASYTNGGSGQMEAAATGMLSGVMPASSGSAVGGSQLPPLPPGTDLPPGLSAPDAISRTLSTLPPPQLLDILSQMKSLVMTDPAKATDLLSRAPQLSYAIFQALLLLGLVDTSVLTSVVEGATSTAPPLAAAQPPPQQKFGNVPTNYGQPPVPTPPQQQGAYPPPPPPPPPAQGQPSRDDLIRQVLAMPQSQIDALPPNERFQIMQLRQQFAGGY